MTPKHRIKLTSKILNEDTTVLTSDLDGWLHSFFRSSLSIYCFEYWAIETITLVEETQCT